MFLLRWNPHAIESGARIFGNFSAWVCFTRGKIMYPGSEVPALGCILCSGSSRDSSPGWAPSRSQPHVSSYPWQKRPHWKRCDSLCSAEDAQRGNRAHPIHFPACMQELGDLSPDIRHLCVLLNRAHRLPLGASKMLKGHCAHICTAVELWRCP